jgi:hypothetical protein
MMQAKESFERWVLGLTRAASCCRELAVITDATEWKNLSAQLLIMRDKGQAIYKAVPLTEFEVQSLVKNMEIAQKASQLMNQMPHPTVQ